MKSIVNDLSLTHKLKAKIMTTITKIGVVFLIFFAVGNAAAQEGQTVVIKTKIYCSHCLHCGSCAPTIEGALLKEKGVSKVAIDPTAGTITVSYDEKSLSVEAMRTVISNLGFDADEVKADATAYENLAGCCKKR